MIILSKPTQINEGMLDGCKYPYAACGQCCLASVWTDLIGNPLSAKNVDKWFDEHGNDGKEGHTIGDLSQFLSNYSIPHFADDGNETYLKYLRNDLDQKFQIILEYQCDGYTNPVPIASTKIRHFVVVYGYDDAGIHIMNPWPTGPKFITWSQLTSCETLQHITIQSVMIKDREVISSMTPQQSQAIAIAIMQLAGYFGVLHRDAESVDAVEGWSNRLAASILAGDLGGVTTVITQFSETPEAAQKLINDSHWSVTPG